ncbi:MAG: response regulator transcription factor [Lachnospiraceae bacterium]|nr:response regulator transcription factor [Lachnospiraceae bacterium]
MALIYIVEDDENIKEIEMFALKNAGYEVQGFNCASVFYARLKDRLPSLVLLDIMLPDEGGLEIVQKLRRSANTRRLPVILVTAKTSELDKVKGLDTGADDYITKPFGVMELISRVKALKRRTQGLEEERLIRLESIFMDDDKRAVFVDDQPVELTYKEYELLKLLLQNAGIVVSRDMILDRVWGTDFEGESRTLDMHIKTLRQKLGSAGAMIRTVRNVGYILNGEHSS